MATKSTVRAANWDLLRSLAMFLVVVTHASGHLGPLGGIPTHGTIVAAAIICDPIFFALSGYFALQPIKRTLGAYYWNKVCTIILPLILYSVLLYFYESAFQEMSLFGYFTYFSMLLGTRWWFIPTLVPCLIAAPFWLGALPHLLVTSGLPWYWYSEHFSALGRFLPTFSGCSAIWAFRRLPCFLDSFLN